MKKIIDWFKDLFYNITDYALILCVIIVVAGILIWRFNILFNLSIDKQSISEVPNIEITENTTDDKKTPTNDDNQDNDQLNSDNNDSTNPSENNPGNNEGSENNSNQSTENNNNNNQGAENSGNSSNDSENSSNNTNQNNQTEATEITFNIPAGSFPNKIADILLEKGLISDKTEFLNRCSELGLDTKLKAGDFTITNGTSLDDVIKLLAK